MDRHSADLLAAVADLSSFPWPLRSVGLYPLMTPSVWTTSPATPASHAMRTQHEAAALPPGCHRRVVCRASSAEPCVAAVRAHRGLFSFSFHRTGEGQGEAWRWLDLPVCAATEAGNLDAYPPMNGAPGSCHPSPEQVNTVSAAGLWGTDVGALVMMCGVSEAVVSLTAAMNLTIL